MKFLGVLVFIFLALGCSPANDEDSAGTETSGHGYWR